MLVGLVSPFVIVPGISRILGFEAALVRAAGAVALVIVTEGFGFSFVWIGVWSSFLFGDLLFSRLRERVVSRILERSQLVQKRFADYLTTVRVSLYFVFTIGPFLLVELTQGIMDRNPNHLLSQQALPFLLVCVSLLFVSVDLGNPESRSLLETIRRETRTERVIESRKKFMRVVARERWLLFYGSAPWMLGLTFTLFLLPYLLSWVLTSTMKFYYVGSMSESWSILSSAIQLISISVPIWFAALAGTYLIGYYVIPTAHLLGYRNLVVGIVAFFVLFIVDTLAPHLMNAFFPSFVPQVIVLLLTFAFLYLLTSGLEHFSKKPSSEIVNCYTEFHALDMKSW